MPIMIFTMLVVLVLAAVVIAAVAMGMEGAGRSQHPEIADAMATTARHLNGEGEPPRALVALFDEIDEVPELDVRGIPGRLRSAVSARSARSASSASSANAPEGSAAAGASVARVDIAAAADDDPYGVAHVELGDTRERPDARAMLDAPASDPSGDDPYGVWGSDADADTVDRTQQQPHLQDAKSSD